MSPLRAPDGPTDPWELLAQVQLQEDQPRSVASVTGYDVDLTVRYALGLCDCPQCRQDLMDVRLGRRRVLPRKR